MTLHRRTVLQITGTAGLAALAGCSALSDLLSQDAHEYSLTIDPVDQSLVGHALYESDESAPFHQAARHALDAILPDGRHRTDGFEPLPTDAYVEHDGRYFQTEAIVTGRERTERTLVRAERVDGETVSDASSVESLPRASSRVIKVLHDYHATDGSDTSTDLLRGDAYVLRRPAELDGPIAGDLDGAAVTMDDEGHWTYRLALTTETIAEPVYETFATEVARDEATFREVVLATRIDAEFDAVDLEREVRRLLEESIEGDAHRETTPLSPPFDRLIERLGLDGVSVGKNGLLLWYDESLFRYGLYVNPVN